jgi:hypothetical protein
LPGHKLEKPYFVYRLIGLQTALPIKWAESSDERVPAAEQLCGFALRSESDAHRVVQGNFAVLRRYGRARESSYQ